MRTQPSGMSRRDFLRTAAGVGAGGLAAMLSSRLARAAATAAPAEKRRPNVILILTDDQGAVDARCYGAKDLYTPNMDDLAKRGTRFTQFYVGAPVCSPSRAALLTGRYPQRAGLDRNSGDASGLPGEQVTIAEMLKKAGYRTAIFGKWHLGHSKEMSPLAQGFDEFFGHKNGCIDNYSHYFYWAGPNRHDLWRNDAEVWEEGRFFPDLIVREAKRFLKEVKGQPFFLYLPFNVPHYPLQGTEKFRKMYAKLPYPRSDYAAFVSTVDEKIGEVLAAVDEIGLRDNTLIIFLSDNGHSVETRTGGGGGSAGPYRGHKFELWEGGIRLPCIACLPGVIPAGQVRGQLATAMDWMPTIAELCGVQPPDRKLDGKSIVPVLKSAEAPSPHKVFHWQSGNMWAVRDGHWKLVATIEKPARPKQAAKNAPTQPQAALFLSDLDADVSEKTNLADKHPEVVDRLGKLHQDWLKEVREQ